MPELWIGPVAPTDQWGPWPEPEPELCSEAELELLSEAEP
jgi:hypothetical protein